MNEIKRYRFYGQRRYLHEEPLLPIAVEKDDGEWVRWEDVERLLRGRDTLMKMVEGMIKEKLESDKTQDTGHK
jgi:hypothetical protein